MQQSMQRPSGQTTRGGQLDLGGTMLRKSLRACVPLLALCALITAAPAGATPAKVGPSTSIDALGDSITRGYDSQGTGCGALADCPANSWATGTNAGLNSYYVRTKVLNPSVVLAQPVKTSTTGGNDAVTGAKMGDLPGQAKNAVKAPNTPDQVLILLGANDICTSTEASMTSVASFRASYKSGLETLSAGLPDARIDVSSIPNIFNLWSVLHTSTAAQLTWGLAKICQSMLVKPTSEAAADKERRAKVQKRNEEFNVVLGEVCAEFIHCQYDKGAAYAIKFATSDVSTLDYFHPTTAGQNKAAENAWNSGPKFSDLATPTTTIAPERAPDSEAGWYDKDVSVALSAAENEFAVAGTEYKINEAAGWTKYTGPIAVSSEGTTTIVARSVDVNGNTEESKSTTIKLDKTAPTFTLTCPSEPVTVGSSASATVSEAGDATSGFASDPNGVRPLNTASPGDGQSESVQVTDLAGNSTTHSCSYDVHYGAPGAPQLTAGASPNAGGLFTLAWSGADPSEFGITYTLAHRNSAQEEFSTVASGIAALQYAFTGSGEEEGTWVYRVQGYDEALNLTTEWSSDSAPVVVDKTAPNPASASADRPADYAGDGGWYKDTVDVSFSDNGDPALADGSPGSGVDPASIPATQTFATDGSHSASATARDNVGNEAAPVSLSVQVDASAPSVEVSCPPTAQVGQSGVSASVSASDGQSGLASDPSGTVPINTATAGPKTVERTAVDNVGHSTTGSCTTVVGFTQVIGGTLKHRLVVKNGESVELTSSAKAKGVTVEAGGALDVEGASTQAIVSNGAAALRICGASVKSVKVVSSSGPVTIGDGAGCTANTTSGGITASNNAGDVLLIGNVIHTKVTVTGNSATTIVTGNQIGKTLTVTGNTGETTDTPNTVGGKSKIQARRLGAKK